MDIELQNLINCILRLFYVICTPLFHMNTTLFNSLLVRNYDRQPNTTKVTFPTQKNKIIFIAGEI